MVLSTINARGEIVARPEKRVRIKMTASIVGEGGKDWLKGSTQVASEPFAREMIRRGKAVEAGAEKPKAEKPNADKGDE